MLILLNLLLQSTNSLQALVSESYITNDFTSAEGWTSNRPLTVTNCGPYHVMGGYNVFSQAYLTKTFYNIPEHKQIRLTAKFLKVDSWDLNIMSIYVDGVIRYQRVFDISDGTQTCGLGVAWPLGPSANELMVNIDITVDHTAPDAVIKFQDSLDQSPSDESWGIREIRLYAVFDCPSICSECSLIDYVP